MTSDSAQATVIGAAIPEQQALHRKIDWTGAFWVASGVPALVLFSIGGIAATVGNPSWAIWTMSILLGFIQSFTYAEIAGLYPAKSGGASVYGAMAWLPYSKLIAPLSVWCNWIAWSPVLAIGTGLAAGYILNWFPADSSIALFNWQLLDLSFIKDGLTLRINSTFVLGAVLLVGIFLVQHGGILRSAVATKILGIIALMPLLLIGILPLISGDWSASHFTPFSPIAWDANGLVTTGEWNLQGWTLIAGGLFIAAWSTYGFETAVCYTREFRNPAKDTFKAIFYSGLLCIVAFTLVPLGFQAAMGLGDVVTPAEIAADGTVTANAVYGGMLSPDIYSGMGVGAAMAKMIGGSIVVQSVVVVMLILAVILSIMTSMAGSSRTLYQGSVDGWLPRYLSHVNDHGAPTRAMWTDLAFNLLLLMLSDYLFVLAASNVAYIIFNFLNLNAGWIHRLDRSTWQRPYRAPTWLLGLGTVLAFVNISLMGLGANVWGAGTLTTGLICSLIIIPVFLFRHYVQDRGVFPDSHVEDIRLGDDRTVQRRAGILPFVTLGAGVAVVMFFANLG